MKLPLTLTPAGGSNMSTGRWTTTRPKRQPMLWTEVYQVIALNATPLCGWALHNNSHCASEQRMAKVSVLHTD